MRARAGLNRGIGFDPNVDDDVGVPVAVAGVVFAPVEPELQDTAAASSTAHNGILVTRGT